MTAKIITVGGVQHELDLERDGTRIRANDAEIEVVDVRAEEIELRVGGSVYAVPYVIDGSTVSFAFRGEIYVADVSDKGARGRVRHREHHTSAPMPGVVLKILVSKGDVVAKGAPLIILEAMKMEHQINAPSDGTVTAINCAEGELVQPGVELVTLE